MTTETRFVHLRALGVMLLALALNVALVDVALETFLTGSAVRWVVVVVVVAHLAGTVALWRRSSWTARAKTAAGVALGLLALTAWLPGGLKQGVVVLTQPTATVLGALGAAAVAWAGLTLLTLSGLPRPVRVLAALLSAYAVVALVIGTIDATPVDALLHGQSLWIRLPFFLQGAFIGMLLLVPAAIVVLVSHAIVRVARRPAMPQVLQVAALATALAVSLAGLRAPGGASRTNATTGQLTAARIEAVRRLTTALTGTGSGTPTVQQVATRLEAMFADVDASLRDLPRDRFDISAILNRVGRRPDDLFAWIREQTYLVPYQGVLRGPTGVLMDRFGNSLDRALLLHALLTRAGHEGRLARGTLTDSQVADIVRQARPAPERGTLGDAQDATRTARALAERYGRLYQLDREATRALVDRLAWEEQQLGEALQRRVAEQAEVLARALGRPPAAPPPPRLPAEHWWVQWRNGASWVDLDPTLPDAKVGQRTTTPEAFLEPDALDPGLYHQVQVSVIIEQWLGGRLQEHTVLQHSVRPAELQGDTIVLNHIPMNWPRDLRGFRGPDRLGRIREAVLAQRAWEPVLMIGRARVTQRRFSDSGDPAGGFESDIGRILGSGRIGGSRERSGSGAGHVTAEWIEYEIKSPGLRTQTVRRGVFDLLGAAARRTGSTVFVPTDGLRLQRGLALLGSTEILAVGSGMPTAYVAHRVGQSLVSAREVLLDLLPRRETPTPEALTGRLAQLHPVPLPLYGLVLGRQAWSRERGRIYLDRPNVFAYHRAYVRPDATGGLQVWHGLDIVANDVAVRPGTGVDSFRIRLEQGVLDTNVEAVVIAERRAVHNVAELLAQSLRQGLGWMAVSDVRDPAWRTVTLPPGARARIERDLAGGFTVVLPRRPARIDGSTAVGWWRITPATGQTIGVGENGWGQSATELAIATGVISFLIAGGICMLVAGNDQNCLTLRDAVVCFFIGLAAGLTIAGAVASGGGFQGEAAINIFRVASVFVAGYGGGFGLYQGGTVLDCLGSGSGAPSPPGSSAGPSPASPTPAATPSPAPPSPSPPVTPGPSPSPTPRPSPSAAPRPSPSATPRPSPPTTTPAIPTPAPTSAPGPASPGPTAAPSPRATPTGPLPGTPSPSP